MSPSPVVPDLSGLTAQVKRVADALYTEAPVKWGLEAGTQGSIADIAAKSHDQVASVIGEDVTGSHRVRTDPDVPA